MQKSSPPFEKGGREGFLGMPFQKAKLIRKTFMSALRRRLPDEQGGFR
jgi:hypothetical protein